MTLGRFLIFFVLGLVIAWIAQWTWLYWILTLAAAWVIYRLIRR